MSSKLAKWSYLGSFGEFFFVFRKKVSLAKMSH